MLLAFVIVTTAKAEVWIATSFRQSKELGTRLRRCGRAFASRLFNKFSNVHCDPKIWIATRGSLAGGPRVLSDFSAIYSDWGRSGLALLSNCQPEVVFCHKSTNSCQKKLVKQPWKSFGGQASSRLCAAVRHAPIFFVPACPSWISVFLSTSNKDVRATRHPQL
jgi:hypothetical protein